MSENKLQQYNEIINSLISESIHCSPSSWSEGKLTIDCDGHAMNCALKNSNSDDKAKLSEKLRALCEELYVTMAKNNDVWTTATMHFYKEKDSWHFNTDFIYPEAEEKLEDDPSVSDDTRELLKEKVANFIKDYFDWNTEAYERSKDTSDKGQENIHITEQKYDEIISKYCPPNFLRQPIAFGSEPNHDPSNEKIIEVIATKDRSLIKTKHTRLMGGIDLSDEYEYGLGLIDDTWYLLSVCVVIDGEKYDSL